MNNKKPYYDVVIVGNGSIGCSIAYNLLNKEKKIKIAIVGPRDFSGSASLAAGAMLNIFGEIEHDTLDNKFGVSKLELLIKAKKMWPQFTQQFNQLCNKKNKVKINKGTFILNNASSDDLDDINFKAIENSLIKYKEKYEIVDQKEKIRGYNPSERNRSLKTIYIPNEDFIDNSQKLLSGYYDIFKKKKNITIYDSGALSIVNKKKTKLIKLKNLIIEGKNIVISCGAYSQVLIDQLRLKKIPKLFFGSGNALIATSEKKISQNNVIRTPNRGMACGLHTVPYGDNHIYIGATNRISDKPKNHAIISGVMGLQKSLTREINTNYSNLSIKKTIVGHRPTTIDTYPLLGPTSLEGVYLATGTKRDGLTMSLLIGLEISNLIISKKQNTIPKFFYPERKPIYTMSIKQGIKKSVMHILSAAYQHDLQFPDIDFKDRTISDIAVEVSNTYKKCRLKKGVPPEILNMYKYEKI